MGLSIKTIHPPQFKAHTPVRVAMGEFGHEFRAQHNDAQFFAQLANQSASGTFSRAALAPRNSQ